MSRARTFAAFAFFLALLSAFLALPITGCAGALAALPDVVAAVVDAGQIIDTIERFVANYFALHPDAAKQADVAKAIDKARTTLNIALRLAQGAQDAAVDRDVDAAFLNFKAAYIELIGLCKPYGVKETSMPRGSLRASPGELTVPQPLAFKRMGGGAR